MTKGKQSTKYRRKRWIEPVVVALLLIFSVFTVACTYVMFSDNDMLEWISQGNFEEESDQSHKEAKSNKQGKEQFNKSHNLLAEGWKSNLNRLDCMGDHAFFCYKAPIRDILTPPPEVAC